MFRLKKQTSKNVADTTLNYSKKFFQISYHTIVTVSESYYQTILTYLELISTVFTLSQSYYQIVVNTFLRVSVDT